MTRSLKSGEKSSIKENKSGVRPNRNTENKKAGDKDRGKKGSSKDLGKKGRRLLKTFHLKMMNREVGMLETLQQKK